MGEIIQYEGVAYKKVDRAPRHGDVVIARKSVGSSILPNTPYRVYTKRHKAYIADDIWEAPVYSADRGRTEETVDVYERVDEHERQVHHLNHPFYKEAREYWQDVQDGQIYKGAEKYPEPFTPSSWTARQLLEHGMQENVDQAHYLYGLYVKVQEMEKELQELRTFKDQVHKTVVKWGAMNEPESGNA